MDSLCANFQIGVLVRLDFKYENPLSALWKCHDFTIKFYITTSPDLPKKIEIIIGLARMRSSHQRVIFPDPPQRPLVFQPRLKDYP